MIAAIGGGDVLRLVGAFVPATWPTRSHVEDLGRRVDAEFGEDSIGRMMQSWRSWHLSGDLPAGAMGQLLLALREVVTGGLGPRPAPHLGSVA